MAAKIKLSTGGVEFEATLNDSETAAALAKLLPTDVDMSRWGEEYYGGLDASLDVPVAADARTEMAVGELAYWKPGNALCIFFGPTPASVGDEPRAASDVNPIGELTSDPSLLKDMASSISMTVEAA